MNIFREAVLFEQDIYMKKLPTQAISGFLPGDTTPDVENCERFVCYNTSALTVTSLRNGKEGQSVKILGDGFTSLEYNTTIITNTGATKLLAANKVYTFTLFSGVWYEDN